jgi:hypothetical protein
MSLRTLCRRLPVREAHLLRLIIGQGFSQSEACDQLRGLIERRRGRP